MYQSIENKIVFAICGDLDPRAECATATGAELAADRLNRATRENNARHYTAAARLIAAAEEVDGFRWIDEE